jgi:hypothetical protein
MTLGVAFHLPLGIKVMKPDRVVPLAWILAAAVVGCNAPELPSPAASSPEKLSSPAPEEATAAPEQAIATPEANGNQPAAADSKEPNEHEGWWQLADDSALIAKTDPTPPRKGPTQLLVEITEDDFEQKFAGTLAHRVVTYAESNEPWQSMPQVREEEHGSLHFQAPIDLPQGDVMIQFRLRDQGDEVDTDLDWNIKAD